VDETFFKWGRKTMKLLLRRDQRPGLLGKMIFTLDVRADLSADEKERIRKYKLQDTELYASHAITGGSGLLGVASRLAWKAVALTLTVRDLENGKRIEVKDVVELLAIEEHIRQAAQTFKDVLEAASHFGGEEVLEL
jgi:F420-0:gamma-glutamyl ligase-like protein